MSYKKILNYLGFKVLRFLGKGSYGTVMLASSKNYPHPVAIKIMDRMKMSAKMESTFLPREIGIIQQVNHPHIVKVHKIFATDRGLVFIVMEAAEKSLLDFIREMRYISNDLARSLFSQLVSAMVCLHQQHDIVHRDLKCDNVLLSSDGQIKLTDFGFGRKTKGFSKLCQSFCGTPIYTAPEILKQELYDAKKSDVWSLGVILYAMVNGKLPFSSTDDIIFQTQPLKYSIPVEESCRDLISHMLQYDPRSRPTMTEVAQHPWLKFKTSNLCSSQRIGCLSNQDSSSSLQDVDSVLSVKEVSLSSSYSTMKSITRNINPVQSEEDSLSSSYSTMMSINKNVNPVQSDEDFSSSSFSTMMSISRNLNPDLSEDSLSSSYSTIMSFTRNVNTVLSEEDSLSSSCSTMKSITRNVNPVHLKEEDSCFSDSTRESTTAVANPKTKAKNAKTKARITTKPVVDTFPRVDVVVEKKLGFSSKRPTTKTLFQSLQKRIKKLLNFRR